MHKPSAGKCLSISDTVGLSANQGYGRATRKPERRLGCRIGSVPVVTAIPFAGIIGAVGATVSAGSGDVFVITGTGNGHNVGMSQYGAKAMAELGYTYDEILKFYYTDITIK